MSYTRTKTTSVHYSGSTLVHYPASDHGGTERVRFECDVPVTISVHVDTESYDRNINQTNAALAGVAGAVTATEAAQIRAIRETGKKVSQSAIRGFFGLVGNELSAKMSESSSALKASMALLMTEAQSVEGIHRQMEGDYQSIKARYLHIFDLLDEELQRRIRQVSEQAFNLGVKRRGELLREPYLKDACGSFSMMSSTHTGQLKLACATAKRKAFGTLQSLDGMSDATDAYQEAVRGSLAPAAPVGCKYLPVLYVATDQDGTTGPQVGTQWDVYQAEGQEDASVRSRVMDYVARVPEGSWKPLDQKDQSRVEACFMRLMDQAEASQGEGSPDGRQQRIHDEMVRLLREGGTRTCAVGR